MNDLQTTDRPMLRLTLSSEGNPDFGQYAPLSTPETVFVETLADAKQECAKYIAEWQLGGGNWTGGQVYDERGTLLGHFSYNGRFWNTDGRELLTENAIVVVHTPVDILTIGSHCEECGSPVTIEYCAGDEANDYLNYHCDGCENDGAIASSEVFADRCRTCGGTNAAHRIPNCETFA